MGARGANGERGPVGAVGPTVSPRHPPVRRGLQCSLSGRPAQHFLLPRGACVRPVALGTLGEERKSSSPSQGAVTPGGLQGRVGWRKGGRQGVLARACSGWAGAVLLQAASSCQAPSPALRPQPGQVLCSRVPAPRGDHPCCRTSSSVAVPVWTLLGFGDPVGVRCADAVSRCGRPAASPLTAFPSVPPAAGAAWAQRGTRREGA